MTRLVGLLTAAGLALGAGACGEVKGNPDAGGNDPDGNTIDGTAGNPDAAPPDAQTRGPVSVHVLSLTNDGLPEQGATVLFYEPDGTLADRKLSDANGDATAELEAGGMVTVVRLRSSNTHITTVAAVQLDDVITVGRPESSSSSSSETLRVVVPSFANATSYSASVGCGSGYGEPGTGSTTAFTVSLNDCEPTGDILVRANVGNNSYFVGQNDVSMAANGVIDLSGQSWQFLSQSNFSLGLTNIPAGLDYLNAFRRTLSPNGAIYSDYADGVQSPIAGSTALAMGYPPGIGSGTYVQATFEKWDGNDPALQIAAAKLATVSSSYTFDLINLLPWVTRPAFDGANLSWSGGAGGDAVVIDLNMYSNTQPATYATWRLVLPPGTTSVTLPELPVDLDSLWNVAGASYYGETTIIELGPIAGYDPFRSDMEPWINQVYWGLQNVLQDVPSSTAAVSTTFQGD